MEAITERSIEVMLLDLQAPEGPVVAHAMRDAAPDVWLVALAVPDADDEIVAWAEAGIAGVLPRDGSFRDLVLMIHSVVRGETVCSPANGGHAPAPGRRARQDGQRTGWRRCFVHRRSVPDPR